MMGNGFQGAMDPRMMMMQMQMQKQGPMGGGPMGPPAQPGMQSMGMRSPNAPQMPAPPQPQAQGQQNPMQGMNMQMLMEALKKRQQQMPTTPGQKMAATPGNQVDPMFGGANAAGQYSPAQPQGGGNPLAGILSFLGIGA